MAQGIFKAQTPPVTAIYRTGTAVSLPDISKFCLHLFGLSVGWLN